MIFSSPPCLRKIAPEVWLGFIPMPVLVIIADVEAGTLNWSAANLITAVKGACSGTAMIRKAPRGSAAFTILNWILSPDISLLYKKQEIFNYFPFGF
jgi:hypothetical protein